MIIILKNISAKASKQDIKAFLSPTVKGGLFSKSGQIEKISILLQKNLRTRLIHYHGLAEITPEIVAKRVIKKLNRKLLLGKRIVVSEYKIRSQYNDPRLKRTITLRWIDDRRVHDRREDHEEIFLEDVRVEGRDGFNMKSW
jgi:hypothetical protein